MHMQESNAIWRSIEQQKMDLYDLIKTYHRIKEETVKSKFMEYVQSLSFKLNESSGFLYNALWEKGTLHIKDGKAAELKDDSLVVKLQLGEFLIASLWIKDKPEGINIADNYVTKSR